MFPMCNKQEHPPPQKRHKKPNDKKGSPSCKDPHVGVLSICMGINVMLEVHKSNSGTQSEKSIWAIASFTQSIILLDIAKSEHDSMVSKNR